MLNLLQEICFPQSVKISQCIPNISKTLGGSVCFVGLSVVFVFFCNTSSDIDTLIC